VTKVNDIYKDSNSENLKELYDKVDCLQRSQVYVHNHITKVENDIHELKNLILRRLIHFESYDMQMAFVRPLIVAKLTMTTILPDINDLEISK
jgi:hypothetical protein